MATNQPTSDSTGPDQPPVIHNTPGDPALQLDSSGHTAPGLTAANFIVDKSQIPRSALINYMVTMSGSAAHTSVLPLQTLQVSTVSPLCCSCAIPTSWSAPDSNLFEGFGLNGPSLGSPSTISGDTTLAYAQITCSQTNPRNPFTDPCGLAVARVLSIASNTKLVTSGELRRNRLYANSHTLILTELTLEKNLTNVLTQGKPIHSKTRKTSSPSISVP